MYGVFPIAVPKFGDAINQPGAHVKRYRRVLSTPCETRTCAINFPPDVQIYSLQDALFFNDTLSFIVNCPPGRTCPPGTYPRVVTFPRGTFVLPDPNANPGFPIVLQLQGCQSNVVINLPANATDAEIAAAAQQILEEVARQQAECDTIVLPPIPNPSPFYSNAEVYSNYPCEECAVIDYDGILPWYITLDRTNNRLVLAVGLITANTQAEADAQAQTFIDNFKTTAVANGKLTCVTCEITTASPLPAGEVGIAYSETLTVIDTFDTNVWTVGSGSLPDGLSLNSATGEISGTPTTEETKTFTIKVQSGEQCCTKEFELEIAEVACGDPANVQFFADAVFLTSGLDVTLASGSFGTNGYTNVQVVDGTPKVAIMQVHWGELQIDSWQLLWSAATTDLLAFGSGGGAFDTTIDKTVRIPVYPTASTITCDLFAPGSSGVNMGDAHCVTDLECVDLTDFATIVWGAPTITQANSGSASGTFSGATFDAAVNNPGGGLDEATVECVGTFTGVANGTAGRLTLTVSGLVLDGGGNWPKFDIVIDSSIDGAAIWNCFSDNGWAFADGTFQIPLVVAYTPGATITVTFRLRTVQGLGSAQEVSLHGDFVAW